MRKKPSSLSAREAEILGHLTNGYSHEEIGKMIGLSPHTIDSTRARLMLKLNIHNLPGLVKYAIRNNITSIHTHRDYEELQK